ncbi:VP3 [Tadarida brasiliensis polyomavirus 1]|nr:VP3 [Tadarida brasiliensis polyomavirus 1]AJA41148.1 VP3 [Tadarida brasiliensis polyomavirus 1]
MTIESLSGVEALAQLGWTTEQFSQLSYVASTFSSVVGYGVLFQTVSGISSLIQAGIRLGWEVSQVNRNQLQAELERIFGTISKYLHVNLSHQLNPLDWCGSMHENFPPELDQLEIPLKSIFGQLLEHGRWVNQRTFTDDPQQESGDIIELSKAPGGANQRVCPDWLLHLILRLNGAPEKAPLCSSMSSS